MSGDPIRLRDFCNENRIHGNAFVYSGYAAMVGDWYQNTDAIQAYRDSYEATGRYECPSWENEILNNYFHKSYYDSANPVPYQRSPIPLWDAVRPEDTHLSCPAGTTRARAPSDSNHQSDSPSETRAHRGDWASQREEWIRANLSM